MFFWNSLFLFPWSSRCWQFDLWFLCLPMDCSHRFSLSRGFFRQAYWSGLPCPSPAIFLNQGSNPCLLGLLHWQAVSLPLVPLVKPQFLDIPIQKHGIWDTQQLLAPPTSSEIQLRMCCQFFHCCSDYPLSCSLYLLVLSSELKPVFPIKIIKLGKKPPGSVFWAKYMKHLKVSGRVGL